MNGLERCKEIVANYARHGWRLRRALLRPETRAAAEESDALFQDARLEESTVDALWFSRASAAGREAWELRLVADTPYALFEAFEADEAEEEREDVRREMEARLREYGESKKAKE
jgi:hypothetical protein